MKRRNFVHALGDHRRCRGAVRSLDTAHALGHSNLIVPSVPDEARNSGDAWPRWAGHFNSAGSAARDANLWLAFHRAGSHEADRRGGAVRRFIARLEDEKTG